MKYVPQGKPSSSVSISERDISSKTAEFYNVLVSDKEVWFPYNNKEGYKVRNRHEKQFTCVGRVGGLFGQELFPKGGKYITITEGEYDALAAFQALGSKWPVVSLPNGAAGASKAVSEAFEWLDSFETVVLSFDDDVPGKKAAEEVAEVFAHKVKILKPTGYKDANEAILSGKTKQYVDDWWRAEKFVPEGVLNGQSLWERLQNPKKDAAVQYPFQAINKLTFGIRTGELVTITAGSGLGKSQFLREMAWKILQDTKENVGMMFLEESADKTGIGLMGLAINKPLHLPTTEYTEDEYKAAFDATLGTGRVFLYDHFGSNSIDTIVSRVRQLAKACGCKFFFLDHISIVVSNQENGDERKAIDEIMTKLRTLVQELDIALICVSHLKRPEGRGHEEGAVTSLAQLRGSGAIAQLSDMVIGLERNLQAEDMEERNTTKIRVLKNRFCGLTGPCGSVVYSLHTGRMSEFDEGL